MWEVKNQEIKREDGWWLKTGLSGETIFYRHEKSHLFIQISHHTFHSWTGCQTANDAAWQMCSHFRATASLHNRWLSKASTAPWFRLTLGERAIKLNQGLLVLSYVKTWVTWQKTSQQERLSLKWANMVPKCNLKKKQGPSPNLLQVWGHWYPTAWKAVRAPGNEWEDRKQGDLPQAEQGYTETGPQPVPNGIATGRREIWVLALQPLLTRMLCSCTRHSMCQWPVSLCRVQSMNKEV